MNQIEPNVVQLVWFTVLWSVCCLGFLQLAGMYPLESRDAKIPAPLVIVSTVLWVILLIGAFAYAIAELRWSSIVVVAGLLFLFIPEPFQAIPERWRNSSAGLAITGIVLAAALITLGVFTSNPITSFLKSIT